MAEERSRTSGFARLTKENKTYASATELAYPGYKDFQQISSRDTRKVRDLTDKT